MPDTDAVSTSVADTAHATDGAAAADASASGQEEDSPSLISRTFEKLFGRRDHEGKPVSEDTKPESKPQIQPSAQKREYSDDEFARAVQAETDRRESKRTEEQKKADKAKLREEDPYAYVDQEKAEEQQRQSEERFGAFVGDVGRQFDGVLLDPVMTRLSEDERATLLKDDKMGVGLEGRKALMDAALESLVKSARAEGEKVAADKLRKNPAFRKQLLAEMRGSPDHEEPDLVPANGAAPTGRDMNNYIRVSLGRSKYRGPSD